MCGPLGVCEGRLGGNQRRERGGEKGREGEKKERRRKGERREEGRGRDEKEVCTFHLQLGEEQTEVCV